ncbi:RGS-domain-containing protein [Rhizophagus clarus]|uniref:RGS-domain-containing protein n=1 Tax=Rhizophagus clarus TaxID=94130 RepID=A0A8H3LQK0_9GLOM|nr:RGS-domain-containing protein [Rhizophagus clarus]
MIDYDENGKSDVICVCTQSISKQDWQDHQIVCPKRRYACPTYISFICITKSNEYSLSLVDSNCPLSLKEIAKLQVLRSKKGNSLAWLESNKIPFKVIHTLRKECPIFESMQEMMNHIENSCPYWKVKCMDLPHINYIPYWRYTPAHMMIRNSHKDGKCFEISREEFKSHSAETALDPISQKIRAIPMIFPYYCKMCEQYLPSSGTHICIKEVNSINTQIDNSEILCPGCKLIIKNRYRITFYDSHRAPRKGTCQMEEWNKGKKSKMKITMIKFGLKFLQDRKKEEKNLNQEIVPELPAFEWQVTEETDFESCLLTTSLSTLIPPEDAMLGVTERTDRRRKSTASVRGHSRSSTNVESGRIRLMQIIDDENSRKNFRNYLVSRYCEENLDFYMDVLKFHSHFKNEILKNNEIIKAANYIWNEYLDPQTSSKPLNVPQELLNQCKQKISKNSFTVDLFDKLQQHCFDLMLQDSLPKFTRNSMAITSLSSSSENYLNSTSSFSYLRPPNRQPSLRKSISSGSLRAKMNSAISSLKTTSESTPHFNSPNISPPPSPSPNPSSQSSASSPTSTSTFSSTSSTSTTSSIPTTPTSTTSTTLNNQQRISMASAMSISNITKKMLLGRRNSISSNHFSVSTLSSVFYLSSLEKFRCMPGSYPCSSVTNNNDNKKDEDDFSSTWQKLRRNISTPNFQSRPRSRSSTLFSVNNNNQGNNCDKKLPPLPS